MNYYTFHTKNDFFDCRFFSLKLFFFHIKEESETYVYNTRIPKNHRNLSVFPNDNAEIGISNNNTEVWVKEKNE